VVLAFAYTDPRTAERVTVEQAVRVIGDNSIPGLGPAAIRCWGVMPSGLLRHPDLAVPPRSLDAGLP
jgi:hypothetical protein